MSHPAIPDTTGHRERLRSRFAHPLTSLSEVERLELLLTYAIPRKNLAPLAQELLAHFGSLAGVLSASRQRLMKIDGISEQTALLLTLVAQMTGPAPSYDQPQQPTLLPEEAGTPSPTGKETGIDVQMASEAEESSVESADPSLLAIGMPSGVPAPPPGQLLYRPILPELAPLSNPLPFSGPDKALHPSAGGGDLLNVQPLALVWEWFRGGKPHLFIFAQTNFLPGDVATRQGRSRDAEHFMFSTPLSVGNAPITMTSTLRDGLAEQDPGRHHFRPMSIEAMTCFLLYRLSIE